MWNMIDNISSYGEKVSKFWFISLTSFPLSSETEFVNNDVFRNRILMITVAALNGARSVFRFRLNMHIMNTLFMPPRRSQNLFIYSPTRINALNTTSDL